jgi:undecaprenyl-phosphate galactose phosphotransferase/putative colanic acid biosynthesis UDP-glucose lipid carrier transferase
MLALARVLFSLRYIGLVVAALDFLLVVVASAATKFVCADSGPRLFGTVEIQAAALFVVLNAARGSYRTRALQSRATQLFSICVVWLMAFILALALTLLGDTAKPLSLASVLAIAFVAPVLLLCARTVVIDMIRAAAARGALSGTRAVVIGDAGELASFVMRGLDRQFGIEQVASFILSDPVIRPGMVDDIIEAVRAHRAEQVIVALPWSDQDRIETLLGQLRVLPTPIVLLADNRVRAIALSATLSENGAIAIELQRGPMSRGEAALKRAFDLVVGGTVLCLLLPVLLLIALAVRADSPGPALFRQTRRGFNGGEFRIEKFRTMSVLEDGNTIVQASANDGRVTRFGRILRRTSLDELPQLLNVLRGDMSLVGPRPHAVAHDIMFSSVVADYASRFRTKPGITGWAQVNGLRGETPQVALMQRRIDLDIWYIDHWSLLLDLKIVALTFREVVRGRNAF